MSPFKAHRQFEHYIGNHISTSSCFLNPAGVGALITLCTASLPAYSYISRINPLTCHLRPREIWKTCVCQSWRLFTSRWTLSVELRLPEDLTHKQFFLNSLLIFSPTEWAPRFPLSTQLWVPTQGHGFLLFWALTSSSTCVAPDDHRISELEKDLVCDLLLFFHLVGERKGSKRKLKRCQISGPSIGSFCPELIFGCTAGRRGQCHIRLHLKLHLTVLSMWWSAQQSGTAYFLYMCFILLCMLLREELTLQTSCQANV